MARLASLRRLLAACAAEWWFTRTKLPSRPIRRSTTAIINSRLDNHLGPVRAVLCWVCSSVTGRPESGAMDFCLVFERALRQLLYPACTMTQRRHYLSNEEMQR